MQIYLHKRFSKEFAHLTPKIKQKTKTAIKQFEQNPHYPPLRHHALSGRLVGQRAFSVTSNVRIIFIADREYQHVTLFRIGTHNHVY